MYSTRLPKVGSVEWHITGVFSKDHWIDQSSSSEIPRVRSWRHQNILLVADMYAAGLREAGIALKVNARPCDVESMVTTRLTIGDNGQNCAKMGALVDSIQRESCVDFFAVDFKVEDVLEIWSRVVAQVRTRQRSKSHRDRAADGSPRAVHDRTQCGGCVDLTRSGAASRAL